MANTGQLPKHLEVAARTGVLGAVGTENLPYKRVALEVDLTASTQTLVDLGGMPIPTEDPKAIDTMIEKFINAVPRDFYLTVRISNNQIDDDQTGQLRSKFQNILPAFEREINDRVFKALNGGDGTTYGLCYDGQNFYSNSHIDEGGKYQTAQDNLYADVLSLDNYETLSVAAKATKDDFGNFVQFNHNLLIVSPSLQRIAAQIADNSQAYDTANREINPYSGTIEYLVVPQFDAAAHVLVASSENTKPVLVAIRKRPALLKIWDDPQAGDGGMNYIMYHGRYNVIYGDWRLAFMGNT